MKNALMYFIVLAVVVLGFWLFMRKGNDTTSLYDSSPSPSVTASASASPILTPMTSTSPTASAKPGPVITTASGLKYQEEVIGTGATAKAGQSATVQYTGTLTNGTKFDSSYDHGSAYTFNLGAGEVIKGWDEGVAGMKVGGKRKLIIPPALGYGAQVNGPIPANSTLNFEVELVSVK